MRKSLLVLPLVCLSLSLGSCSRSSDRAFIADLADLSESIQNDATVTSYTSTVYGKIKDFWNSTDNPVSGEGDANLQYFEQYQHDHWDSSKGDNPYSDEYSGTWENAMSTLLMYPVEISTDSAEIAALELGDYSFYQTLAGNNPGLLRVKKTADGGLHFYVRGSRFIAWIYAIAGVYDGTDFGGPYDPIKAYGNWNIDLYYSASGLLQKEELKIAGYTSDPEGNIHVWAEYQYQ